MFTARSPDGGQNIDVSRKLIVRNIVVVHFQLDENFH